MTNHDSLINYTSHILNKVKNVSDKIYGHCTSTHSLMINSNSQLDSYSFQGHLIYFKMQPITIITT